ncbi:MAG: hypothetical protein JWL86_4214 [Rhizobium sp.]|jgi:cobalt-zinc-cadmium efflux system protein|nr:hypothetical protein [Rhizobium sp.]
MAACTVDSAVAVAIGLWVLPRTWILLKDSLNILLEGVPEGVGVRDINEALRALPGVASVHDLHVWAISSGKVSLTAHVVRRADQSDIEALLQTIRSMLSERYKIHHVTIQIEATPCDLATDVHRFGPAPGSAATAGHGGHAHGPGGTIRRRCYVSPPVRTRRLPCRRPAYA